MLAEEGLAIPQAEDMMWPTLVAMRELGGSGRTEEITTLATVHLGLPEELQEVPHREGRESEIEYRLAWARTYLKHVGAITQSSRGVWALTDEGESIDELEVIVRTRGWKAEVAERRRLRRLQKSSTDDEPGEDEPVVEPEDIEEFDDWKDELISHLLKLSPAAFERLSQRLLREAGFVNVMVTGRSGDGGIDGVGVYRMSLVSFSTLFQCKRFKGAVNAHDVRDFRGAMMGRSEKGLIITTGRFTQGATSEANRTSPVIDLIDGSRLCDLLREYALGVTVTTKVVEDVQIEPEFLAEFD